MKMSVLQIAITIVVLLALGMLIPSIASADPAGKVNVCHATGQGKYIPISISENALPAHLAHGDVLPGTTEGTPSNGTSYPGQYGSTVTPVITPFTTINNDCTSTTGVTTVLRIESTQSFGSGGWAGWSCIEPGYPKVVGGGVVPATAVAAAQGPAKYGAAAVGVYNYPVYPHYTYNGGSNTPGGEEGWVVQAGSPVPTGIFVLCGP